MQVDCIFFANNVSILLKLLLYWLDVNRILNRKKLHPTAITAKLREREQLIFGIGSLPPPNLTKINMKQLFKMQNVPDIEKIKSNNSGFSTDQNAGPSITYGRGTISTSRWVFTKGF